MAVRTFLTRSATGTRKKTDKVKSKSLEKKGFYQLQKALQHQKRVTVTCDCAKKKMGREMCFLFRVIVMFMNYDA